MGLVTNARRLAIAFAFVLALPGAPALGSDGQPVRIVIEPWPPFADPALPGQGFLSRLTEAAFETTGHRTEIHFIPWARALHEVERGYRHVIMGLFHSEEREAAFRYSDPVYEAQVGLVALRGLGRDRYDSLDDLGDYTIGIGRGFANSPAFDAAVQEDRLDVYVATEHTTHVRMLFAGRLDLIAGTVDTILHAAEREGYPVSELVVLDPPLMTHDIHIGVSRAIENSEALRDDFDRGLRKLRESGRYDEILSRYRIGN
ncbi:MAG: transporter substrate-binding domain-containing protein [Ectothiorhodospiraceae bacterium]|nr:transporter substrate-binding domain-containing protein [Ectothiorhodospiraceae bacterium]